MAKKKGNPAGEVHAGEGFDEKLKKLGGMFADEGWSFTTKENGVIDGARLQATATEQEADNKAEADAIKAYKLIHDPAMRRSGERGALYQQALDLARAAAKGNKPLLAILDSLKIRTGGKPKAPEGEKQGSKQAQKEKVG